MKVNLKGIMPSISAQDSAHTHHVLDYYAECWLSRFSDGHNPKSKAMHLGYFTTDGLSNDDAKLKTNQLIAEILGISKNEYATIVDLGCGIGGTCIYLAQRFSNSAFTGVNISKEQLKFAEHLRSSEGLTEERIQLELADYAKTSLKSSSSNYVFALESLCHAQSKESVYAEVHRILADKGVFLFVDYFEIRVPDNREEEDLLNIFRNGWAVSQYIRDHKQQLLSTGFHSITEQSLVDHVKPGIDISYETAIRKLEKNESTDLVRNHLLACKALKQLVDLELIDYRYVRCVK